MKITYFGHSAFLIETVGLKALIDPYITDNPLCTITLNTLKDITHIFVTHGHSDHVGDTEVIAKKNNSIIVCNFELGNFFSKNNLRVHSMNIGGNSKMSFGSVKMTNAVHSSGIKIGDDFVYGGNPNGFIIEAYRKKIFHAGDTGITLDMKLLADENIDVALLPIGGTFTMDIDDAIKAVEFIKPKIAIPMHYNTFEEIKVEPLEFKNKVTTAEVKVMSVNEYIEI